MTAANYHAAGIGQRSPRNRFATVGGPVHSDDAIEQDNLGGGGDTRGHTASIRGADYADGSAPFVTGWSGRADVALARGLT